MTDVKREVLELLKLGNTSQALERLFDYASTFSREHLEEVTSQITRYQIILKHERSGTLALDERLRLEAQVSSSALKMLASMERRDEQSTTEFSQLKSALQEERSKRIDSEYRLSKLESSLESPQKLDAKNNILVRENNVGQKVELRIFAISKAVTQEDAYAIVLGEINGPIRLPIVIGPVEAQAIALKLEGTKLARPLTHDLLASIIEIHGTSLESIIIDALNEGIHYAKLRLVNSGRILEIDSRCSDAIALAVACDAPIYTYKYILDGAGVIIEEEEKD